MIADAFDDRVRAAVAHTGALAREAAEERLAAGRAVERDVADEGCSLHSAELARCAQSAVKETCVREVRSSGARRRSAACSAADERAERVLLSKTLHARPSRGQR